MDNKLERFSFRGEVLEVVYVETTHPFPGVRCDIYVHPETKEKDLAIITIEAGKKTGRQRVLKGKETIEGYISGMGKLTITHADKRKDVFELDSTQEGFAQIVEIGEIMQLEAGPDGELVMFEICVPPWEDGRYEDLKDDVESE